MGKRAESCVYVHENHTHHLLQRQYERHHYLRK